NNEPRNGDHGPGEREWLPPSGAGPTPTSPCARPEGESAHLTRILGSIRPYRTSTMKFTVM
ncbi:MAG: hypothetical protein QOF27_3113, partial [Gaiellaceae bacterium]|nr:hypothetical protein [Gaiellaceae bacterium]